MMDQAIATKASLLVSGPRVRDRRYSGRVLLAGVLGDAAVVFIALAFSSWLRFGTSLAHFGVHADWVAWRDYLGRAAFGTILFIVLLPHREMYDLHQILHPRQTIRTILRAAMTWFLMCSAFSYFLRFDQNLSRIYAVVAFATTTTSFLLWRLLLYALVSSDQVAQRLRQRVLFAGWSRPAMSLAQAIVSDRRHAYDIVGYVPFGPPPPAGPFPDFVRPLGDYRQIADVIRERDIDMVILADPHPAGDETIELANLCEKEMVDFKVIPSGFEILLSCLNLQTVSGVPVLGVSRLPLDHPLKALAKQIVDVVGGLVGLFLSAPIIVAFGIMVYRESPGPIIYRQRRLGRDGRPFWIFKIRSMKMDAEKAGKAGWTVKNDPRRLKIGAFMRKWNIDELPQFWNVLRGEMSLVGPRPERPELITRFKEEIPHYNARHSIKPGLTGWAQVNGFRGDTDLTERVRCDLYYIENWSLLLDLQIMFMTLWKQKNSG